MKTPFVLEWEAQMARADKLMGIYSAAYKARYASIKGAKEAAILERLGTHDLTIQSEGEGLANQTRATCSCGWTGQWHGQWSSYEPQGRARSEFGNHHHHVLGRHLRVVYLTTNEIAECERAGEKAVKDFEEEEFLALEPDAMAMLGRAG
jgi:hypothetical protein